VIVPDLSGKQDTGLVRHGNIMSLKKDLHKALKVFNESTEKFVVIREPDGTEYQVPSAVETASHYPNKQNDQNDASRGWMMVRNELDGKQYPVILSTLKRIRAKALLAKRSDDTSKQQHEFAKEQQKAEQEFLGENPNDIIDKYAKYYKAALSPTAYDEDKESFNKIYLDNLTNKFTVEMKRFNFSDSKIKRIVQKKISSPIREFYKTTDNKDIRKKALKHLKTIEENFLSAKEKREKQDKEISREAEKEKRKRLIANSVLGK
jgi:hypothetical protein